MYLTYEKYQEFGGTLTEAEFLNYERKARLQLDRRTFNRLKKDTEYPNEVLECMYVLIGLIRDKEILMMQSQSAETTDALPEAQIKSQSNDGVSVSYNVIDASDVYSELNSQIQDSIENYLSETRNQRGERLLYRGYYSYDQLSEMVGHHIDDI